MNRSAKRTNILLGIGIACMVLGVFAPCLGGIIGNQIEISQGGAGDGTGMTGIFLGLPVGLVLFVIGLALIRWVLFMEKYPPHVQGKCIDCGYDLTGNKTGNCPECGKIDYSPKGEADADVSDNSENSDKHHIDLFLVLPY